MRHYACIFSNSDTGLFRDFLGKNWFDNSHDNKNSMTSELYRYIVYRPFVCVLRIQIGTDKT